MPNHPSPVPGLDWTTVQLSPEEGFVLSRVDGHTQVQELVSLTQLPLERVQSILERLVETGCITYESAKSFHHDMPSAESSEFLEQCRRAEAGAVLSWLERGALTPAHARALAAHHPTSAGLDALCQQPGFAQDEAFIHHLLKNPQLTEGAFRKVAGHKPLLALHKLAISRDVGEKSKRFASGLLRQRFTRAEGEEQASLIAQSEGRVLALLIGVPLSAKGAAALCGRPIASTLLIQNLSRWPSTPPNVLTHLLRQPVLRSHPELKRNLQRHPNAPSEREGSK